MGDRSTCSPRQWTVHTRLTVYGSLVLLAGGTAAFLALEWANSGTLGGLSPWGKVVGGITGGVVPRTAGFNSIDYGDITPETMAVNYVLMFIGGGSGSTAGGIKVTTFFLLAFVIWTEVRGERDTNIAHRQIGAGAVIERPGDLAAGVMRNGCPFGVLCHRHCP